jgi:hypothetical protein
VERDRKITLMVAIMVCTHLLHFSIVSVFLVQCSRKRARIIIILLYPWALWRWTGLLKYLCHLSTKLLEGLQPLSSIKIFVSTILNKTERAGIANFLCKSRTLCRFFISPENFFFRHEQISEVEEKPLTSSLHICPEACL